MGMNKRLLIILKPIHIQMQIKMINHQLKIISNLIKMNLNPWSDITTLINI